MMTFLLTIPASNIAQFFTVELEGYQVKISYAYNLTIERWVMDVENQTLGIKSIGIVMNQGTDLLNSSSKLGLQALVLSNTSNVVGLEANTENLGNELVLAYMDLDTYHKFILDNAILSRSVYRKPVNG